MTIAGVSSGLYFFRLAKTLKGSEPERRTLYVPSSGGRMSSRFGYKAVRVHIHDLQTSCTVLLPDEGHYPRRYLGGALHRCKMAAALEDFKLRLRNKTVHLLALMKRHDAIIRAPHDQHRHLEPWQ